MVYIRYMTVKQTNINHSAIEVPNAPILTDLAFSTILASLQGELTLAKMKQ